MELLGRWWNGHWSRLLRRDVWLHREVTFHVRARVGNSEEGTDLRWQFSDEQEARTMVDKLLNAPGQGEWRDITDISR